MSVRADAAAAGSVIDPRGAWVVAALGCVVGLAVVVLLGREAPPRDAALAGLGADALVFGALALRARPGLDARPLDAALLVVAAVLLAPLAWLFGPSAGVIAAPVALALLVVGLLAGRGIGERTARAVALALAGGPLAVLVLVVARVLPDLSLTRVLIPGHPDWQHVAAHLAAQMVFLVAFVAGGALRERYAEVEAELERTVRQAPVRAALLDEARAEYRRALRVGRANLPAERVVRASEPPPPDPDEPSTRAQPAPPAAPAAAPASATLRTTALFREAFRGKMHGQHRAVLALCAFGAGILLVIARNRVPLLVALASMGAIAGLSLLGRHLARTRGEDAAHWPWALIAALSVGPAYSFGMHSAFACVVAALLFVGSSFRAASGAHVSRRLPVLAAVVLAHGGLFVAIATGRVPDAGNVPVLAAGHAPFEPVVLHAMLQGSYVIAFAAGWMVDARHDRLAREATRAASLAAREESQLARADAEIVRVLSGAGAGLFTGERIGPYELGRLIASGAVGDVYEAARAGDAGDAGRVAIKLVRRERATDPLALELLTREAAALGRIRSPFVARILEAGADRDLPYVAMELIEGPSLAAVLRARRRLPLEELRRLVRDLSRGLADVHDAGLLHRDVKPHNVMLTATPEGERWKLVDFGLAGAAGRGAVSGGTPAYMAPEQALGERVDPRADLYSLGLVVYRALTGRPAFLGSDREAIARAARASAPPDPAGVVPVPSDLRDALRLALAASPSERFSTPRELAAAFEAAFEGRLPDKQRSRARALPWASADAGPPGVEGSADHG